MSIEQWKWVVGYEGRYQVSDRGRVRSVDGADRMGRKGRTLRPYRDTKRGYEHVVLSVEGVRRARPIHQLVLEAFTGPRPTGNVARHLNDDPVDNRPENLAWGTPSENTQDCIRLGNFGRRSTRDSCPQGHDFSSENTYVNPHGSRVCRICQRASAARFRARAKARTTP